MVKCRATMGIASVVVCVRVRAMCFHVVISS